MRRVSYRPYIFLILLLLSVMSFPKRTTEKMRSAVVASLAPTWQGLDFLKTSFFHLLTIAPPGSTLQHASYSLELDRLREENQALQMQIETIREWLLLEDRIQDQVEKLKNFMHHPEEDSAWKDFFRRRSEHLCTSIDLQLRSLPAKVIFREPDSWNSSVWLNIGEKDNKTMSRKIVAKNSPVLLGTSLIGVVEYVGQSQCRVRLITDSGLVPSVRALRGSAQNFFLLSKLEEFYHFLQIREDLFPSEASYKEAFQVLSSLRNTLIQEVPDRYLAKGELHGSSSPLWRCRSQLLRGEGFNYDFADEEGPARDLRTGEPLGNSKIYAKEAVLKIGDLLVTTGLDGVFPPGLHVGIVTKINLLREGACTYELEARSSAGDLDELKHVIVIPPLEFDPKIS